MAYCNLVELRRVMQQHNIAATIVPSNDPHASEYTAKYWKSCMFFSGFTGSAGTLVVTLNSAAIWTDSRYFIQAENQLRDAGIELMREGLPQTPAITDWLTQKLKSKDRLCLDTQLFSVDSFKRLVMETQKADIAMCSNIDLISLAWKNRPTIPQKKVFLFKGSTQKAEDKIGELRNSLKKSRVDGVVLTLLDEIAWLLNIRGEDVEYNPVAVCYAFVSQNKVLLFIDKKRLETNVLRHLKEKGIEIKPYFDIFNYLAKLNNKNIAIDYKTANYAIFEAINQNSKSCNFSSFVAVAKSVKNSREIAGFRRAMIKDGVALTKFFLWLETEIQSGVVSELSASRKLFQFRSEQKGFLSESFATIAAYAHHGAIVHYQPTESSNINLEKKGFFLLDSGGHYLDGTTDITRTVALGSLSKSEKIDFTLVLKGHIELSMSKFLEGTRGSQLDVLARQFLWQKALNYGHGTGHGVGFCLNVHEGPQSIRPQENPQPLLAGMVTSNEPGIYRKDKYGIRLESLILTKKWKTSVFGNFLQFQTLTLFPFDLKAIDKKLLSKAQTKWLNSYHKHVYLTLSPHLGKLEKKWLLKNTRAL